MDLLCNWILQHAEYAHWFLFGAILLAGMNIPISIDLLMIFAAFLAAVIIPDHLWHLYLAMFLGCYLSAFLGYWMGRLLGHKLKKYHWFNRIASEKRMNIIKAFYLRYGFWTLLIGRFIPLGVRNCIFILTGASRMSFIKFALWDLVACFTWSSLFFYLFLRLSKRYPLMMTYPKTIGILIFGAFFIAVIIFFWHLRGKKSASKDYVKDSNPT